MLLFLQTHFNQSISVYTSLNGSSMAKIHNKEQNIFQYIKVKHTQQISLHEFAAFGSDEVKTSLYILNKQKCSPLYIHKADN